LVHEQVEKKKKRTQKHDAAMESLVPVIGKQIQIHHTIGWMDGQEKSSCQKNCTDVHRYLIPIRGKRVWLWNCCFRYIQFVIYYTIWDNSHPKTNDKNAYPLLRECGIILINRSVK
jgi:hypothetical protein